jgi:hypothetical protein
MTHSSTWFSLILIASALLLSAARNASGEPHSKQHASKVETAGHNDESGGGPVATTVNQSATEKANTGGGGVTYNYNGNFKYSVPANSAEGFWKKLGDVATVLSTIAVAVFTFMLWYVSKRQKELMEKAEDISRRSLEVAALALNTDRPYVFIESPQLNHTAEFVDMLRGRPTDREHIMFTCNLRNHGNGVALLESVRIRLVVQLAAYQPYSPKTLTIAQDPLHRPKTQVIGAESKVDHWAEGLDIEGSMWRHILRQEVLLIVLGLVEYKDVFRRSHTTKFCLYYDLFFGEPRLVAGRDRHNRFT